MTDKNDVTITLPKGVTLKKVDVEKLIVWALRKRDIMYKNVGIDDHLQYVFNFEFVEEQAPPIHYDDIIKEFDTESNIESDTEQDTHSNVSSSANTDIDINASSSADAESNPMGRSPNNTMLFKNWIEGYKIKKFDTQEFVDAFACINKDKATKIISYQVDKETIRQIGINRFEVMKEIA